MKNYTVTWTIDAENYQSPREAAEWALSIQRDSSSTATVFYVTDEAGNVTRVDLDEDEPMNSAKMADEIDSALSDIRLSHGPCDMPGGPLERLRHVTAELRRRQLPAETNFQLGYDAGRGESLGCTCCQVSTESTRADEDECPSCGHLMRSHTREQELE